MHAQGSMKTSAQRARMFKAKEENNLSFEMIAQKLGCNEVYAAAIFYGQAKPCQQDLDILSKVLNIPPSHLQEEFGKEYYPDRGGLSPHPPTDPTLYRFHEMMELYGYPLKAIIHEKFGDGIMSAVDFKASVDKVQDPQGDRVKITLDGKFLPFKRW